MNCISISSLPKPFMIDNNECYISDYLLYSFERSEQIRKFHNIFLNSNKFGVFELDINDSYLYSQIFRINKIDAIFSDGLEYHYTASYDSKLELDLKSIYNQFQETAYIYISIEKNYFNIEKEKSYYKKGSYVLLKEQFGYLNEYKSIEPKVFLYASETPPNHCAYIPIAKLIKEDNKVVLTDFIPPLMNIHSDARIYKMGMTFLNILKKKLFLLNEDAQFAKKSENPIFTFEWCHKNKVLMQCISSLESILNIPGIHPMDFYFECNKIFSQVCTLHHSIELPEIKPYDNYAIFSLFNNLFILMSEIIEQEIPEKYKVYKFIKKENIYYIRLPMKNLKSFKIGLKKQDSKSEDNLIDWMKSALICERRQFNSMKEKRALGFERKHDNSILGIRLADNYHIFDIYCDLEMSSEENTLIIYQTSSYLNSFDPKEIVLCEMKNSN